MREQNRDLRSANQSLAHDIELLKNRLHESTLELDELHREFAELVLARGQLRQRFQATAASKSAVESELDSLTAELSATRARLAAVARRAEQAQQQAAQSRARAAAQGLQQQLLQASERAALAENRVARLENGERALRERLQQAQAGATSATRQLEALASEQQALQEQLNTTRAELAGTQARHRALLEQQLARAKQRAARLNSDYRALLETQPPANKNGAPPDNAVEALRERLHAAQAELGDLTGAHAIHTVKPDDSLSTIATLFYEDGARWRLIFEANRHLLDQPDLIYSGMLLVIPPTD